MERLNTFDIVLILSAIISAIILLLGVVVAVHSGYTKDVVITLIIFFALFLFAP